VQIDIGKERLVRGWLAATDVEVASGSVRSVLQVAAIRRTGGKAGTVTGVQVVRVDGRRRANVTVSLFAASKYSVLSWACQSFRSAASERNHGIFLRTLFIRSAILAMHVAGRIDPDNGALGAQGEDTGTPRCL
jgi:hypothetical protein